MAAQTLHSAWAALREGRDDRRGELIRWLIALGWSLMALLGTLLGDPTLVQIHIPLLVDLGLGALGFVGLALRHRWPATTALLVAALTCLSPTAGGPWIVLAVSLGTHRRWPPMASFLLISVFSAWWQRTIVHATPYDSPWIATSLSVLYTCVLLAIGAYVGERRELEASLRERAETAEREQAWRVTQARMVERAAIAREMHDVLAHRMSLVAMHAGALTYRTDLSAEQTRTTAELIQHAAHEALVELRSVLGLLNSVDSAEAQETQTRPQPTLRDLGELLADLDSAGARIELIDDLPTDASPPDTISRHAFRIVQESCTNAGKHAPGQPVRLRLAGAPGEQLYLEITNPLPSTRRGPLVPGSGLGLAGLTERAALSGGSLNHGITADERFRVRAWLPWPAEDEGHS